MFENLIKRFAIQFSVKQFSLLTTMKNKSGNEIAAVFFKAESPVIYFVSIVDFDMVLANDYKDVITRIMDKMFLGNRELFNNAVCVHLILGNDISILKQFADTQESVYDSKIHNVWWYADNNKVYAGNGQPDKVHGIEKILGLAMNNSESFKEMSIEEINKEWIKKSQLMQVTKFPLLVVFLVIINLFLFLFDMISGNLSLYTMEYGINGSFIFSEGQLYRLFTYMFLHGSIEHVVMNCLSLFIFGSKIEKYCGRVKTMAIYLISGIAGGLLSALFNTGFSIGASGAIFGMLGALLAISKKTRKRIDGLSYITIGVLVVVSIGMGVLEPQIDNFGHIGGLIGGFVLGFLLYKDKKE